METKEYQKLIDKLEERKQQKARIEGAIEQIQKQLEEDYNLKKESEIQNFLDDLDSRIKEDQKKLTELEKQLNSIVDWENL